MLYTHIFYTALLFACLIGVGAGWLLAFSLAGGKRIKAADFPAWKKRREKPPPQSSSSAGTSVLQDRIFKGAEEPLRHKLHRQDGSSFFEFYCGEVGEDHEQRFSAARSGQDMSYGYIKKPP